jgi:hypothetical protein
MDVRKVLAGVAVSALGVAVLASVANAASPCGRKACSDEVGASGLRGQARQACFKQVIADCNAGACSCTGGSPPCSCVCGDGLCGPPEDCSTCPQDCGTCPTTTSTTTSTSTTTTTLARTACMGGSGYPTCDGSCPAGEQCGVDADLSPLRQSCACFPVGVTPCGSSGYPECGGACFGSEVCQAFHLGPDSRGESRFCACVDASENCALQGPRGLCDHPGTCPPGQACTSMLVGTTEFCDCSSP